MSNAPLGSPLPVVLPLGAADAGSGTDIARREPGGVAADLAQGAVPIAEADKSVALPEISIHAHTGWQLLDLRELYAYRDLFRFLVRREIKVRYAQSAIGVGWAILQPLFTMVVFTVIFGRLAHVPSNGAPYALFSFAGLVPWMYFSNGVADGVNSLIANSQMLSKVYFPRLLLPLSAVAARFIDFAVASVVMCGLMVWYGYAPNWGLLALPWLLALMVITAAAITLWLSTLAIQFRDVKHALSFIVQIIMYTAPVVYPASLIPVRFQLWYALNPMVAVIEGFRSSLLGTREMPWMFLGMGTFSCLLLASSGLFYFNRRQRSFADVA